MCELRPWLEELANIAGYMSRAEQNDRKLLQESKGMEICKVSENSVGTKSVYHGLIKFWGQPYLNLFGILYREG